MIFKSKMKNRRNPEVRKGGDEINNNNNDTTRT